MPFIKCLKMLWLRKKSKSAERLTEAFTTNTGCLNSFIAIIEPFSKPRGGTIDILIHAFVHIAYIGMPTLFCEADYLVNLAAHTNSQSYIR